MQLMQRRRRQKGFTLLEVLVALIVLSIGLLGLSGLQTVGLRNNYSAAQRSQATLASNDIIDRMRANRDAAEAGNYNINYGQTPSSVTCTICSVQQVATKDLGLWHAYVARLPAGESDISVDAAGLAVVKVRWNDARDVSNMLELVTKVQL